MMKEGTFLVIISIVKKNNLQIWMNGSDALSRDVTADKLYLFKCRNKILECHNIKEIWFDDATAKSKFHLGWPSWPILQATFPPTLEVGPLAFCQVDQYVWSLPQKRWSVRQSIISRLNRPLFLLRGKPLRFRRAWYGKWHLRSWRIKFWIIKSL